MFIKRYHFHDKNWKIQKSVKKIKVTRKNQYQHCRVIVVNGFYVCFENVHAHTHIKVQIYFSINLASLEWKMRYWQYSAVSLASFIFWHEDSLPGDC